MYWPFWETLCGRSKQAESCLSSPARPEMFPQVCEESEQCLPRELVCSYPPPVLPKTQLSTVTIKFLQEVTFWCMGFTKFGARKITVSVNTNIHSKVLKVGLAHYQKQV